MYIAIICIMQQLIKISEQLLISDDTIYDYNKDLREVVDFR